MSGTLTTWRRRPPPPSAAYAAVLLLAGCDAQVSTGYTGEALLTLHGSVQIDDATTDGALQPALAFLNPESGEIAIVDTEVQGQFPAKFSVQVYDPPPSAAFNQLPSDAPGTRMALAFITAVTARHPASLVYATEEEATVSASQGPNLSSRQTQTRLCTSDGQRCFTQTLVCPTPDSPTSDCTVMQTGDPTLSDNPWQSFAGISQNYAIVYLEAALPAGSPAALALGTLDRLEQGYNLLSIRPLSAAELAAQTQCEQDAEETALERFNQQHGTSYDSLQIAGLSCAATCPSGQPACSPPPADSCKPAATPMDMDAYSQLLAQVKSELGCSDSGVRTQRVADPASADITVEIGPSIDPLTAPSAGASLSAMSAPAAGP